MIVNKMYKEIVFSFEYGKDVGGGGRLVINRNNILNKINAIAMAVLKGMCEM